tara:strand:+ start:969 stop:1541 length:573 start_codon:yes stop_codon:yes gene_type:complete
MNNFLIVGQPRTGTDSVIKMLRNFHAVKDYTLFNKKNGTKKWLGARNTVAKMHTSREYNQYQKILKEVIKKITCVYFTKTRSNLVEHFVSLLCVCTTRSDEHNILVNPVYPIKNDICFELISNFIEEYKKLDECINSFKKHRWKRRKNIDVFQGFKPKVNKYSKNFTNSYFENTVEIKSYINEKLYRNKL